MWQCLSCGLLPLYGRQVQGAAPSIAPELAMRRFQITYLTRPSRRDCSDCASLPASQPVPGECVMSMAVTTPAPLSSIHGLWSELRVRWDASPMVPSLALLRFGACALTSAR